MKAFVALEGALADAVMLALERAEPRWEVERSRDERVAGSFDVVIVDESLPLSRQRELARAANAPLCVLGVDLAAPFGVAALRAAAAKTAARRPRATQPRLLELVAVDPPLCRAIEVIEAAAKREGNLLITGPTGVGKELLARHFHDATGRKGPFVPLNCAAMSDGLVESTLFGHVRGAFTGAHAHAKGAFLAAQGGTLFLDEIGELDPRAQAKLLRVIEEQVVCPIGSFEQHAIDVRLAAATNRELRRDTGDARFRADLYFRLATFVVEVPELRRRPADLEALIDRLLADRTVRLSPSARGRLRRYAWPGNVRELRNVLARAVALARSAVLGEEELSTIAPELFEEPEEESEAPTRRSLAAIEREQIAAVQASGVSVKEAAEALGIHRTTLWRKSKRARS